MNRQYDRRVATVAGLLFPSFATRIRFMRRVGVSSLAVTVALLLPILPTRPARSQDPSVAVTERHEELPRHLGTEHEAEARYSSPSDSLDFLAELERLEPTLAECIEQIATIQRRQGQDLERLARRARRANWLPYSVRIGGVYRNDREDEWRYHVDQAFEQEDILESTDIEDRLLDQTDRYFEVRAQAEWRLSELVSARDELAIQRIREQRRGDLMDRIAVAIEAFTERRQAQMEYFEHVVGGNIEDAALAQVRVTQHTAILNQLSDGWFDERLSDEGVAGGGHIRVLGEALARAR